MNLSAELINGILQYLGSRPFVEVATLINAIQTEATAQASKTVETPKDPE